MKYTIAGIVVTDALILAWAWCRLDGAGFAFMAFALACVTFFGGLPVALGVWTRRLDEKARRSAPAAVVSLSNTSTGDGPGRGTAITESRPSTEEGD